jgi:hypothetical protein
MQNTNTNTESVKLTANEKLLVSQYKLETKENKSTFDFVKLANVTDKLENKTISKVYKEICASPYILMIIGKADIKDIPTHEQWKAFMPTKDFYSNFDGYKAMAKFNVKAQTAKKVALQDKATAKI